MTRGIKHIHQHWHQVKHPHAFGYSMTVFHSHEHYHSHASHSMATTYHGPHRHTPEEQRDIRAQQLGEKSANQEA